MALFQILIKNDFTPCPKATTLEPMNHDIAGLSIGQYLAKRLEQVGLKHYFAIPGDYNLALLDEFLTNDKLKMIGCCNELNAGYAADGYARAHGLAAVVVTYTVGGLSLINAIGGAYAEDLPVIAISGGPNTHSEVDHEILHHTLGETRLKYMQEIYAKLTCGAAVIQHAAEAPLLIDQAIERALRFRKPVYLEVACNLPGVRTAAPSKHGFDFTPKSDPDTLAEAVDHAATLLNKAAKPCLVAGVKLRATGSLEAFKKLIASSGYGVAAMPNAKGLFSEAHPQYLGIYWGPVSWPACSEVVESSDAYLFAGPIFSDYTTTGYSTLINEQKLIEVEPHYVKIQGKTYHYVFMREFLDELGGQLKSNGASLETYQRIRGEAPPPPASKTPEKTPVTTRFLFHQIQESLTSDHALIAETGDSWFNAMRLKLPEDCGFEIQMQYGSIGWSVGATLGYALGAPDKRVVALIGDGSFQMTAQEISTMIRYDLNPIIFLLNNRGYTIEVEIHDGIYNQIKNWQYKELVKVFGAGEGKAKSWEVKSEADLLQAITEAKEHNGLAFIEVHLDPADCNKHLLEWGSRVAHNNSRPPSTSK